jgi:uncharacterized protein YycO
MKTIIYTIIILVMIGSITAYISGKIAKPEKIDLKTGDLLFTVPAQRNGASYLSKAIDEVTQTELATNYTHIGIVETDDAQNIWVIHAEPEKGVCREPLQQFLESRDHADIYRLQESYRFAIPEAISNAQLCIGQPYDYAYLLNDSSHYCSGFIFAIFESNGIFELEPMTFIDQETGDFHPLWEVYYEKLGIHIPEGKPGCNPNGMATSNKLEKTGTLRPKRAVSNK